MKISELLRPTREKIITSLQLRLVVILPYFVLSLQGIKDNPSSPTDILISLLVALLLVFFRPVGLLTDYLIACILVWKVGKRSLRIVIMFALSLGWVLIAMLLLRLFVLPVL